MMDQPQGQKPALTVIIQSWWTPALAVIMLVVGLLVGFLGRGLIYNNAEPTGAVAAVTTPVTTSAATLPAGLAAAPTPTVDPTVAAIKTTDQLMALLVSNTTHFEGDPNAKVTIIEFSDYQ
jgi:protein-disulfide isomerase